MNMSQFMNMKNADCDADDEIMKHQDVNDTEYTHKQ